MDGPWQLAIPWMQQNRPLEPSNQEEPGLAGREEGAAAFIVSPGVTVFLKNTWEAWY